MKQDIYEHDNPHPAPLPQTQEKHYIDLCAICVKKHCPTKTAYYDWSKDGHRLLKCKGFLIWHSKAIQFILRMGFWVGACLAMSEPFSWLLVLLGAFVAVGCVQLDGAISAQRKNIEKAHQCSNTDEQQDIA